MKVKLSDLYDIGSSKRVFQSEWRESGVPFYRAREIAKLSDDGFVDNELFIDEELYSQYTEKYGKPEAGDVMVTGVGTLGVCYVVKPEDRFYFKDGNILWFRQKAKDKILPEYLVKVFDSKEVKDFIAKNSSGTTVGTFTIQTAKKMEISLPSLDEQKKIIDKIIRTESIIKQRKKELQLLDTLIKARFVEMFESVQETCEVGYYVKSLIAGKSLAGELECENKVLKTGAVSFDYFDVSQMKNLPVGYKPQKEHLVNAGDIIISRMNTAELTGAAAYVWSVPEKVYIPDRLWKVVLEEKCNPIFVWQMLIQPSTKEQIKRECSGTSGSMKNISKAGLLGIKVKKVHIDMQNQFANFVKQIDKSKSAVKKALDETQLLFDSLMQEYFG